MSTVATQNGRQNRCAPDAQSTSQAYVSPGVNIFETGEGYVVEAEMPGLSKDGLDISLEGNELTIVGRRAPLDLKADAVYRESYRADFRRVFQIDPAIDTAKINAKINQGVVTIQLPKSDRVKPRKVVVND